MFQKVEKLANFNDSNNNEDWYVKHVHGRVIHLYKF